MITFNDLFKPEVKELNRVNKELNQVALDCLNQAKICLNLEQFAKYKEQYRSAEAKMLQTMTLLTEAYQAGRFDLLTYGSRMLVYMTRLKDLRSLVDTIETEVRKSNKNG